MTNIMSIKRLLSISPLFKKELTKVFNNELNKVLDNEAEKVLSHKMPFRTALAGTLLLALAASIFLNPVFIKSASADEIFDLNSWERNRPISLFVKGTNFQIKIWESQ